MFCDGICKKKSKRCGLLADYWLENKNNGKKKQVERCVFFSHFESSLRIEDLLNGLHAAENSTRNEAAKGLNQIKDVIGTGFSGMLKSVKQRGLINER